MKNVETVSRLLSKKMIYKEKEMEYLVYIDKTFTVSEILIENGIKFFGREVNYVNSREKIDKSLPEKFIFKAVSPKIINYKIRKLDFEFRFHM